MITNNVTDYLEALVNILRSEQKKLANEHGLQLIHLQIIHYLARCNRYSNTLLVLCEFLGQTKGTVSTSVSLLEKKQLVRKEADLIDKRKQHLKLTADGKKLAKHQSKAWSIAESQYQDGEHQALLAAFDSLLRKLQQGNNYKVFGVCHTCRHFKRQQGQVICGLTQEMLQTDEHQQLCVHHNS